MLLVPPSRELNRRQTPLGIPTHTGGRNALPSKLRLERIFAHIWRIALYIRGLEMRPEYCVYMREDAEFLVLRWYGSTP